METLNYLNNGHGLKSWLLTKDHKRIALLYLVSITLFFVIGGFFAMLVRLELLTPAGDLLTWDEREAREIARARAEEQLRDPPVTRRDRVIGRLQRGVKGDPHALGAAPSNLVL